MNKKKTLMVVILALFVVGMTMGTATAAHTIKWGNYKGTLSNAKYNKLKEVYYDDGDWFNIQEYTIKTKSYKKVKVPVYKNKKVKKYKWVYKYKVSSKGYFYNDGSVEYDYYHPKAPKGYKLCGDKTVWNSKGTVVTNYYKYKKKVAYYTTKKVKTGKYKTVKKRVYLLVGACNAKDGYVQGFYYDADGYYKFFGKEKQLKF